MIFIYYIMKGIISPDYTGIQFTAPCKSTIVHAFDLDDTLTMKPVGFDNTGMTKDDFFDASKAFMPDYRIVYLLKLLHRCGDAIAVCTARPADRLTETCNWLRQHRIPYDCIMLSNGTDVSGNTKQHMLKYLRRSYRMVGTLIDDSPYNCEGARLQRIKRIHVLKNEAYWNAHPEYVTKQ